MIKNQKDRGAVSTLSVKLGGDRPVRTVESVENVIQESWAVLAAATHPVGATRPSKPFALTGWDPAFPNILAEESGIYEAYIEKAAQSFIGDRDDFLEHLRTVETLQQHFLPWISLAASAPNGSLSLPAMDDAAKALDKARLAVSRAQEAYEGPKLALEAAQSGCDSASTALSRARRALSRARKAPNAEREAAAADVAYRAQTAQTARLAQLERLSRARRAAAGPKLALREAKRVEISASADFLEKKKALEKLLTRVLTHCLGTLFDLQALIKVFNERLDDFQVEENAESASAFDQCEDVLDQLHVRLTLTWAFTFFVKAEFPPNWIKALKTSSPHLLMRTPTIDSIPTPLLDSIRDLFSRGCVEEAAAISLALIAYTARDYRVMAGDWFCKEAPEANGEAAAQPEADVEATDQKGVELRRSHTVFQLLGALLPFYDWGLSFRNMPSRSFEALQYLVKHNDLSDWAELCDGLVEQGLTAVPFAGLVRGLLDKKGIALDSCQAEEASFLAVGEMMFLPPGSTICIVQEDLRCLTAVMREPLTKTTLVVRMSGAHPISQVLTRALAALYGAIKEQHSSPQVVERMSGSCSILQVLTRALAACYGAIKEQHSSPQVVERMSGSCSILQVLTRALAACCRAIRELLYCPLIVLAALYGVIRGQYSSQDATLLQLLREDIKRANACLKDEPEHSSEPSAKMTELNAHLAGRLSELERAFPWFKDNPSAGSQASSVVAVRHKLEKMVKFLEDLAEDALPVEVQFLGLGLAGAFGQQELPLRKRLQGFERAIDSSRSPAAKALYTAGDNTMNAVTQGLDYFCKENAHRVTVTGAYLGGMDGLDHLLDGAKAAVAAELSEPGASLEGMAGLGHLLDGAQAAAAADAPEPGAYFWEKAGLERPLDGAQAVAAADAPDPGAYFWETAGLERPLDGAKAGAAAELSESGAYFGETAGLERPLDGAQAEAAADVPEPVLTPQVRNLTYLRSFAIKNADEGVQIKPVVPLSSQGIAGGMERVILSKALLICDPNASSIVAVEVADYSAPDTDLSAPDTDFGAPATDLSAPDTAYSAPVKSMPPVFYGVKAIQFLRKLSGLSVDEIIRLVPAAEERAFFLEHDRDAAVEVMALTVAYAFDCYRENWQAIIAELDSQVKKLHCSKELHQWILSKISTFLADECPMYLGAHSMAVNKEFFDSRVFSWLPKLEAVIRTLPAGYSLEEAIRPDTAFSSAWQDFENTLAHFKWSDLLLRIAKGMSVVCASSLIGVPPASETIEMVAAVDDVGLGESASDPGANGTQHSTEADNAVPDADAGSAPGYTLSAAQVGACGVHAQLTVDDRFPLSNLQNLRSAFDQNGRALQVACA